MSKPKAFVSDKKKKVVSDISSLIKEYPIIGLVDMENLPAPQLQKMKQDLRGKVVVKMTKARLIKIALDNEGEKYSELKERIRGMPALIFTKDNPFKLYKTLAESKSAAPAKAGQVSPRDVIVPAGKTPFAPGPVIGELGQLGIKSGIEDGKVAIKVEKLLVKEGEKFQPKVAEILTRLSIFPMEVGLNIVAVYEDGVIFDRKVLEIDEELYINNLKQLHNEAINLAMKIGYASKDTIKLLIRKAYGDAEALADSCNILTSENVGKMLAKGEAEAKALKNKVNL